MHRSDRLSQGHGRRAWLLAVPAGLGLAVMGWTARRWCGSPGADPCASPTPGFPALAEGQPLQRWTVVRVHPLHLGAVPIVLETAGGQRYQVDVLARDPEGPEGVAHTDRLSLFVVNSQPGSQSGSQSGSQPGNQPRDGADGRRTTDEEQGLGAMVLAQALAAHEPPPGLLTLEQRLRDHAGGAFMVPLA